MLRYRKTPTEKFRYKGRGSNFCNNVAEQVCELRHDVVHVERLPLGMAYPEQAQHIAALLNRDPLSRVSPDLVVDCTGVGLPVVQTLEHQGLEPLKVTIAAGAEQSARACRGDQQ